MQQAKQSFWARLQLLARLTLNAGNHPGNQPARLAQLDWLSSTGSARLAQLDWLSSTGSARLAQLDDGNDRAILVQGDEGPAQVVRLGHRGTPSVRCSDEVAILAARPIASIGPSAGAPPYAGYTQVSGGAAPLAGHPHVDFAVPVNRPARANWARAFRRRSEQPSRQGRCRGLLGPD
jgi:hypothetical protein